MAISACAIGFAVLSYGLGGTPAHAIGPFGGNISQTEEIGYGREADTQIQELYAIYHAPWADAWVDRIGERLAPYSDRPDLTYVFRVLDDPTVNAFSVPGYVYVDSGLLDLIKNDRNRDDELAGVIAHEMGHIGGRHVAHEMDAQQSDTVLSALAGWATHGKFHGDVDLGADLYLLGHDPGDEADADRRAVDTLMRARVDPEGYVAFLRKVQTRSSEGCDIFPYLQVHPLDAKRMDGLEQDIQQDRLHGVPPPQAG